MSKSAKIYLWSVSVTGICLGLWCTMDFLGGFFSLSPADRPWKLLIFLFLLCIFSKTMPIYISENQALDISFIGILSSLLILGPEAAVTILMFSFPFVVECGPKRGDPVRHIFNTPLIKTFFNFSNMAVSIYLPGRIFLLIGGTVGEFVFPQVIWQALVFIILSLILNAVILLRLLTFDQKGAFGKALSSTLVLLMPNMAAMAPMGLLMAFLLLMPNGIYMSLIFLLPLMLARYAFKLYINSKNEYYQMVQLLVATLEAKDKYTEGHSKRVSAYAEIIARSMRLSSQRIENIKVSALLHDIGKIGISDGILNKEGPLTGDERLRIQQHPQIGSHILEHVNLDPCIREIVLHHHNRYDGGGYPMLRGETVSLEAFIIGVADSFDAITSDRSYRRGMSRERAIEILLEERGKQFHPNVVDAFVEVLHSKEGQQAVDEAAAASRSEQQGVL